MNKLLLPTCVLALCACAPLPPNPTTAFNGGGYAVEVCDAAYAGRAAACGISGQGARQVIRANVIGDSRLFVGGSLLIDATGRVDSVGCRAPPADAVLLDCPGALVSAGLMNLHEHIDYSYQQPARPPLLRWLHRNDWRKLTAAERGFEGDAPVDKVVATEVSERAMLRHAMSGVTSISGAKDYQAFLRNLKVADAPTVAALTAPVSFAPQAPRPSAAHASPIAKPLLDNTFPVNDAGSKEVLAAPCSAEQTKAVRVNLDAPFIPHVGEGTNAGAAWEVDCVLDAIRAKTTPSAFIHGVAINSAQVARLKAQDVAVVLSPRSNFQLYGATAPVAALKAAGVRLAIGTDWSPSGSLTLLDEGRCLMRHNRDSLGQLLSAADLHRMMTSDAARAVGLQGQVGSLAPGELADLVVLDTEGRRDLGEVLAHSALPQTLLVMIGGRVASAPLAWAGRLPQLDQCSADARQLCGVDRLVCGANAHRPLDQLLRQVVYTLDDSRLCRPQATDDCVAR